VNTELLAGALWFMVRGLYYHVTKRILPDDYVYAICPIQPVFSKHRFETFGKAGKIGRMSIGRDVFEAKYTMWSEDTFTTFWCLQFYDKIVYDVSVTSSANAQQHLIPAIGRTIITAPMGSAPIIVQPE
jgi:hypothetical protein